jgi:hypothetical protein
MNTLDRVSRDWVYPFALSRIPLNLALSRYRMNETVRSQCAIQSDEYRGFFVSVRSLWVACGRARISRSDAPWFLDCHASENSEFDI